MALLGNQQSQIPQIQMPQGQLYVPAPTGQERGDTLNAQAKELDTEMQKHILNVNPLENAFKRIFCGWRDVVEDETINFLGIQKTKRVVRTIVDPFSRSLNESGASYLFNNIYPLVHPTATTSNVEDKKIIMMWRTTLDTINMELLTLCLYPSYLCDEEGCGYFTANLNEIEQHAEQNHHYYDEVHNPYDMNLQRHQSIINTCGKMYFITLKAGKGWTLEKLADTMVSQSIMRNGMPMQPQQNQNMWDRLWNRR